jgi:hypothetical protein
MLRVCSGEDVHNLAWRRIIAEPVDTIYRKFVTSIINGRDSEPTFRRGAELQKILDLCFHAEATKGVACG